MKLEEILSSARRITDKLNVTGMLTEKTVNLILINAWKYPTAGIIWSTCRNFCITKIA